MSFHQKLRLVRALGLITSELMHTVEFINGLRNKISHDLNFEISEKEECDLLNCTPKYLREIVAEDSKRKPGPIRFHESLHIILLQIEVIRQNHAFKRLSSHKSNIRLRTVLEKTEGAIYNP